MLADRAAQIGQRKGTANALPERRLIVDEHSVHVGNLLPDGIFQALADGVGLIQIMGAHHHLGLGAGCRGSSRETFQAEAPGHLSLF